MAEITTDTATQSNPADIATSHAALVWDIDFDARILSGHVVHDMNVLTDNVKEIIFDTRDLAIHSVELEGSEVKFRLGSHHPISGTALNVPLPTGLRAGSSVKVKIVYSTTEVNTALQWLDQDQTQGKEFPYLFSQCQPIYARALAPFQDTPSNKFTYSASVSAVLPVLMSAQRVSPSVEVVHDHKVVGRDVVTYEYTQPIPIPSYLIAIAVGNVRYRPFNVPEGCGWMSGIWAEPEMITAAHWEFEEATTQFLAAEEKLVLPYRFGVYDLLVLPPSFPYGGMENACLTFLTPTLLTGDRSLVTVVVHELTHSWFGNGITHANPSHFWLNEGWTTYFERLLRQKLDSPAARGFAYIIGAKSLQIALAQYEATPKYRRLVIAFEENEDPDFAYSRVPYEKGANFILHLERTLGGLGRFLPYARDYVSTFTGKSITTQQWRNHLYQYWAAIGGPETVQKLDSVDWDAWLYGESLELPVEMEYDHSLADAVYELARRWDQAREKNLEELGFSYEDIKDFDANQMIVLLEKIESYPPLPSTLLEHLGAVYRVSNSTNAEIRLRFYRVALLDPSSPAAHKFAHDAVKWVVGADESKVIKGRMKFCRPIFKAVAKVDKALAMDYWQRSKKAFHPIAIRLIDKDLKV
ncbi:hypothetical protein D9619_004122 [Psilocybe cf. subviscida]|uniref:Peptidase M1 leukotriene A4 hydrolase/aminopeptidase C-terminal domain-containing protein n=1 Tax=Psilocybe cf. subviscida TaxID=2480587 RepID=A0A8H5BPK3_9AGAR|nr:hypothetical protein D9619_004122 [Psilocybe cf. subviscida]